MSRILTPELTLDVAAYKAYSPLFLGTLFTLAYGSSFAALSAVVVHTVLFHGREIIERAKLARNQDADVHLKMMKKYVDTPDWWYYAWFIVLLALSLTTVSLSAPRTFTQIMLNPPIRPLPGILILHVSK